MIRVQAFATRYALDALVIVGFLLVAYGLAQYSAPLGPIVLGAGLIATVRLGAR
jgi:hypothetical protein